MYRANPLRSVADYEAELLRNDLSKQQIAENALAFGEKQRGIADQTALRTAMSGLGGGATNAQRIQTARASGSQAGNSLADTLEKADLERRKTEAAAGKQELEAAEIKHKLHVMDLWSVTSPEAAIAWAESGLKSGVFKPEQYQRGVQALQESMGRPGGFEEWKQKAFAGGMTAAQQMEQARLAANADVTANNQPLIKGPDGKWVVNQPLEGSKSRVASAGAANQLGAPIAGVVPGTDTPVFVQPPRTPGGVGQVVQGVVPAPKAGAEQKPIPRQVVQDLEKSREVATATQNLANAFKSKYANKGLVGFGSELSLDAAARLGIDKETVLFWKDYRKMVEIVERHAKFGASLSGAEKKSWDSADISPGMDADIIRRNLATRTKIANDFLANQAADYADAGYGDARIQSIAKRAGGAPEQPKPGAPSPARVRAEATIRGK